MLILGFGDVIWTLLNWSELYKEVTKREEWEQQQKLEHVTPNLTQSLKVHVTRKHHTRNLWHLVPKTPENALEFEIVPYVYPPSHLAAPLAVVPTYPAGFLGIFLGDVQVIIRMCRWTREPASKIWNQTKSSIDSSDEPPKNENSSSKLQQCTVSEYKVTIQHKFTKWSCRVKFVFSTHPNKYNSPNPRPKIPDQGISLPRRSYVSLGPSLATFVSRCLVFFVLEKTCSESILKIWWKSWTICI